MPHKNYLLDNNHLKVNYLKERPKLKDGHKFR